MNETLLTAARQVVECFDLDIQRGEMISIRTQLAVQSLRHLVERETARHKAKEEKKNDA